MGSKPSNKNGKIIKKIKVNIPVEIEIYEDFSIYYKGDVTSKLLNEEGRIDAEFYAAFMGRTIVESIKEKAIENNDTQTLISCTDILDVISTIQNTQMKKLYGIKTPECQCQKCQEAHKNVN